MTSISESEYSATTASSISEAGSYSSNRSCRGEGVDVLLTNAASSTSCSSVSLSPSELRIGAENIQLLVKGLK